MARFKRIFLPEGAQFIFKEYPGYRGAHTRQQAEGAIANGTRIVKVQSDKGEPNPVGAQGVVLGSIKWLEEWGYPAGMGREFFLYFVEWDDHPRVAAFLVGSKIARFS